jgi:hypothetical protein
MMREVFNEERKRTHDLYCAGGGEEGKGDWKCYSDF